MAEVTQSEIGQKQKLQTVLEAVQELLRPHSRPLQWTVDCKRPAGRGQGAGGPGRRASRLVIHLQVHLGHFLGLREAARSGGRQWSRGPIDKGRSHTRDALMSPGFRVERGCFWLVKGDFQSQGGGLGYKTEA